MPQDPTDDISVEIGESQNLGWKIFIGVSFLLALGLLVVSAYFVIQNREQRNDLIRLSWLDKDRIAPPEDPSLLVDYEKVRLAEYIAPRLLEARQAEAEDTGLDEESLKSSIQRNIDATLAKHGITRETAGAVEIELLRPRPFTIDRRLARYFNEVVVTVEIGGNTTRQQILAAIMEIEDTNPFIKARDLELTRSRDDDYAGVDAWHAEIAFVWFEHRERETQ